LAFALGAALTSLAAKAAALLSTIFQSALGRAGDDGVDLFGIQVRSSDQRSASLSSFRLLAYVLKMPGRRAMLLPVQYAWFEPVLIATIVVFIIDLVGNSIGFGNRFLSALMSAIVFALVFGTLVYFGYGSVSMSVTTTPSATAPAQTQK
jgi:hypothetical protein